MAGSRHDQGSIEEPLRAKYRALATSIAGHREQAERLQELANQARARAAHEEHALLEFARAFGMDPQMGLEQLDERLRGRRLTEIAIQVLAEHQRADEPVHYKQWFEMLRQAGFAVGGRNPLATFLATVSRSPHVRAVGSRSGLYVLVGGRAETAEDASVTLSETDDAPASALGA